MPVKPPVNKKRGGKLEDDAVFREIGGQLAGLDGESFDYSKWQRTHQAPVSSPLSIKENVSGATLPAIRKQPKRPDTVQTGMV